MPNYERAPDEVNELVQLVADTHHGELLAAGLKIDVLFAHAKKDKNGDPVGPALKHQGYRAKAIVKITGLKDRAKGLGDCELVIDGDEWDTWSLEERRALIDHELTHLKLVTREGVILRDDLSRPRLACRLHDVQVGWFVEVAARHGEASTEQQQARQIFYVHKQQLFPFAAEFQELAAASDRKRKGKAAAVAN